MSVTFPNLIQPKQNLTYKKHGSKKRALTRREAADAQEIDKARAKNQVAMEAEKVTRHQLMMNVDTENDTANVGMDDVGMDKNTS